MELTSRPANGTARSTWTERRVDFGVVSPSQPPTRQVPLLEVFATNPEFGCSPPEEPVSQPLIGRCWSRRARTRSVCNRERVISRETVEPSGEIALFERRLALESVFDGSVYSPLSTSAVNMHRHRLTRIPITGLTAFCYSREESAPASIAMNIDETCPLPFSVEKSPVRRTLKSFSV